MNDNKKHDSAAAPAVAPQAGAESYPPSARDAFETWAKEQGYQRDELARSTLGLVGPEYFNLNTEMAWKAWQASATAALRARGAVPSDVVQQLGARLATFLDEDQWAECEKLLLRIDSALATAPAAPMSAQAPSYEDCTPHLHVGDSAFESWYSNYLPNSIGHKQIARDAYAAGMGDPLVAAAPQPPAALPGEQDAALKQLIAAAESMVSTVDSHDSDALLELDADPHPPSTINADADNLHRALIAFKVAAKGRTDGGETA